jgi:hypothetical protein
MAGFYDLNLELMQYAVDYIYKDEEIEYYRGFYGADWIEKMEGMNLDDGQEELFIRGMASMYSNNIPDWMKEFYSEEDGFNVHNEVVIDIENESLRLTDCSKEGFQEVVDLLSDF